jgi:hypothetical protein
VIVVSPAIGLSFSPGAGCTVLADEESTGDRQFRARRREAGTRQGRFRAAMATPFRRGVTPTRRSADLVAIALEEPPGK